MDEPITHHCGGTVTEVDYEYRCDTCGWHTQTLEQAWRALSDSWDALIAPIRNPLVRWLLKLTKPKRPW